MNRARRAVISITFFFALTEVVHLLFLNTVLYPAMGIPAEILRSTIGFIVTGQLSTVGIASFILWLIIRPLQNRVTERNAFLRIERSSFSFIIIINVLGYIVAPTIITLVSGKAQGFILTPSIRLVIASYLSGPAMAVIVLSFLQRFFRQLKIEKGIEEQGLSRNRVSFHFKFILYALAVTVLLAGCLFLAGITWGENVAGIGNLAVSFATNSSPPPFTGLFTPLLRAVEPSGQSGGQADQVAKGIIADWPAFQLQELRKMLPALIYALVFFLFGLYIIGSNWQFQFKEIMKQLSGISELKGDLSKLMTKASNDELGNIQSLINTLLINLNLFFSEYSRLIHDIARKMAADMEKIASVEGSNREVTEAVSKISEQFTAVGEMASATDVVIRRTIDVSDDIVKRTQRQIERISSLSATIEELNGSIQSISQTAAKANSIGKNLALTTESSFTTILRMKADMDAISHTQVGIASALKSITSINTKISLLAMNAAIEAAHAGDAGKGFAVIADEISKLAQKTQGDATNIVNLLSELTETIRTGVTHSGEMISSTDAMKSQVSEAITLMDEISAAISEEATASRELMKTAESLVEDNKTMLTGLQSFDEAYNHMNTANKKLNDSFTEGSKLIGSQEEVLATAMQSLAAFGDHIRSMSGSIAQLEERFGSLKLIDETRLLELRKTED